MKLWYTAQDLADLALPGLPGTKRKINELAEREGWRKATTHARDRAGRGGGMEYHLSLLPAPARLQLLRQVSGAVALAAAQTVKPGQGTDDRDARLVALKLAQAFRHAGGLPQAAADALFAEAWNAGQIEAPADLKGKLRNLSARSLARWRMAKRDGLVERLAVDRGASRRGSGVLERADEGQVKVKILALHVAQPHLTADHIREIIIGYYGESLPLRDGHSAAMPSIRTFQHALKAWMKTEKVALTSLINPDKYKSHYALAGRGSYRHVQHINQLWMIDASPADAMLIDGRHSIYMAVDVATRRLKVTVTKTPRSAAVQLLMRNAILTWGCPQAVKTDNGSDFVARDTLRLLDALDIEAYTSAPFSPEEKAFVERAIGTFQRDLCPLLPGFVGHNVADRKAIEERRSFAQRLGEDDASTFKVELTANELQAYCDEWAESRYAHRKHGGLKGKTPFEAAAAATGPIRMVDERALDVLLMPVAGGGGLRIVTKSGIRIDHFHYLCPAVLPETEVLVRMDPADKGRALLFQPDGHLFLGEAICAELAGIDPVAFVQAAQAERKRIVDERMAEVKAEARRIARGPRLVDLMLRKQAEEAGKLVAFPKPRQTHATPALDAALQVTAAPVVAPASSAETALQASIAAEIAADMAAAGHQPISNVQPLRTQETPAQRYRRAAALRQRVEAGQGITTDEAVWLGGYETTAEFKSQRDIASEFGEAALS
jgi:putative transposase